LQPHKKPLLHPCAKYGVEMMLQAASVITNFTEIEDIDFIGGGLQ
jgi:hypothetical protein